jgi:hypothetical protein
MKILLLGDSHTFGDYGKTLESLLTKAGHNVTRVGWVGANAGHYLSGNWKKLTLGGTGDFDTAKSQSYDLAVITLGTNDAAALKVGGPAAERAAAIRKLADEIRATSLWWVGPPAFDPKPARTYNKSFATDDLNARAARLWAATSPLFPGRAIDPREATKRYAREADIHFDAVGGRAWAQFVADAIARGPSVAPARSGVPKVVIVVGVAALVGVGALWWLRRMRAAKAVPAAPERSLP